MSINGHAHKIILIFILFLLIVSPLKILGLLGVLFLGGYLLKFKVDYFYKLIIFFSVFFAVNTLFAAVAFLFNISISVTFLLLLYAAVLGYLYIRHPDNSTGFQLTEVFFIALKVAASLILFILLISPLLSRDDYSAFSIVSFGGDNVSHIELIKAVENVGGYYYRPFEESRNVMVEGLSGYPQGLHINIYVFEETLRPIVSLSSNYRFVLFFYMYCSVVYIVFGWMFILATKGFVRKNIPRSLPGIIAALVLFTGTMFSLFALGSHSQIASMMLFLSMLGFLRSIKSTDKLAKKQYSILFTLILLGGISFTWLFLLPVAGLIAAIVLFLNNFKSFTENPRQYVALIVTAGVILLISFVQPVVQMLYSSPKMLGVNEPGFSITPSLLLITALVLLAFCFLMFINKNRVLLLTSLTVSAIFSALIYIYQFSTVGSARYYLYKSLFVVVMVAMIIVSIYLGSVLNTYTERLSVITSSLVLVTLILAGSMLVIYNTKNPNSFIYQRKGGAFSRELSVTAIKKIDNEPASGKSIIAVGSCNRAQDHTATRLVGALSTGTSSERQALLKGLLLPNKASLLDAIRRYQADSSENLIIISADYPLQNYLATALNVDYGSVSFVDIDFGHIPKTIFSCPEAVR